jgi:coniferyl-aldehyde dehydrogenase
MLSTEEVQAMSGVAGDEIQHTLSGMLALQRSAVEKEPYPELKVRKDRLRRALDVVTQNEKRIVEATQADFGKRPELSVLLADLLFPFGALRHALANVERWMRPEKRKADFPFNLLGARAYVFYQPLGVVGIMAPWNLPFGLGYAPLAGVLAAGNRAMIKPSELTPHTSALMAEITGGAFAPEEVAVAQGGVELASRFSALPFDHLIFTGSAAIARQVMRAAADNLTPVTLELGGKAPVIIARGADLDVAANKVVNFKMGNAGQACMGIDHVVVHGSDRDAFVAALKRKMGQYFPDYANNPDVCHVFLANQRQRLARLVEDAAQRGAKVDLVGGSSIEQLSSEPNFPLTLVIDPPQDAAVMQEEIFGPVLPIVSYDTLEEVVRQVRSRERPLALYFLGGNKEQQDYLLRNTWAGGVTFDDIMLHALTQDLPFGGVGESGMGRYGGHAGFKTFSNAKSVAHPPRINIMKMDPPYTAKMVKTIRGLLKP